MVLQAGQILDNRYRIVKLLAQGGFCTVYRAWDISLNHSCALKENLEISPEAQRQFVREAQILASLSHPNLPRVTDHFVLPGQGQYLVMDFIEGEDLQEMLDRLDGPLPEDQAIPWIEQVCEALAYMHGQNPPIIHRDLKPANIKIDPMGRAILVDFGIAKTFDSSRGTMTGARGVTPGFSPPEQYGQGGTDNRSDIYALGATLYALLTGLTPPDSVDIISGNHPPPLPLHRIRLDASVNVSAAIERAMQPQREQRFQDVSAFKAELSSPYKKINLSWYAIAGGVFLIFMLVSSLLIVIPRLTQPSPTKAEEQLYSATLLSSAISSTPSSIVESPVPAAPTPSPTAFLPTPTTPPFSLPQGTIVFTCFINGMDQICSMDSNGNGYTQLTNASLTSWYASLSFDGQHIVFSSHRDGPFEIYRMDVNGNHLERLTSDTEADAYAPAISPDGQSVAFANYKAGIQSIWLMNWDGSNPHLLTGQNSNEWDPVWSPDGSRIAFASDRTGSRQLFVINADGTNLRQITEFSNIGGRSNWSPDGQSLIFYAGPKNDHDIYRVGFENGNLEQITDGGDNLSPCYSPDGEWITFSSKRDGDLEIYIMRSDGNEVAQLTFNDYSDYQPWWGK